MFSMTQRQIEGLDGRLMGELMAGYSCHQCNGLTVTLGANHSLSFSFNHDTDQLQSFF